MPGAGTDKTKRWIAAPAPVVILVEPQLGENIGAVARAMANFGISQLRLVKPRCGWPSREAQIMASGADRVLDGAALFDDVAAAIADCTYVIATTARSHDQAKPVIGADAAVKELLPLVAAGETVALMFGRERNGLENDEVGLCDAILTLPVNPAFASLNLAQAVVIVSYEWFKVAGAGLPFGMPQKSPPAAKEQVISFFRDLEDALEEIEYFRPAEKRETMLVNMRNIFNRMQPTKQDMRTLHGVIMALAQGRKGPAEGGVLDAEQAQKLRELLAETPDGRVPMRGLSRLLRRNPTAAERALWSAITSDRRFVGSGLKRQTPIGPHIVDFVSFPLRLVIELVPHVESEDAAKTRAQTRDWLKAREYQIFPIGSEEIESDLAAVLDRLAAAIDQRAAKR